MEHIPEVQLQTMVVQDSPSTWNIQQDCSLLGTADKRNIFPSLLNSNPIRPILPKYNNNFGSRQAYHNGIEARIKPDIKYDHDVKMHFGLDEGFNQLLRGRVHSVTSSSSTE